MQSINLISTDPRVRNGRPCIADTTIEFSVVAIVKIVHSQSPEQIAADYELTLPQVYTALAYYYEHKSEIDATIQERQKLAQEMEVGCLGVGMLLVE